MTFTARARSGTETHYQIERDEDELPQSSEQGLAAAVLLQAWSDASATPLTVKYGKGFGSPERIVRSARRFLTAQLPCPWARYLPARYQLKTRPSACVRWPYSERDIEMSIKPKTGGGARPGAPVGRKPGMPVANAAMTDERKAVFLSELGKHGIVTAAARAASPHAQGTCAPSFYILRRNDPEFAAAWDDAIEQATGSVELELHRRAVDGYEEPVYQKGELVGTVTKYSDRLLEIRAKALMPNKYIERRAVELSANLNVTQELYGGHALTLKPEDVLLLDEGERSHLLMLLGKIARARGEFVEGELVQSGPAGYLGTCE